MQDLSLLAIIKMSQENQDGQSSVKGLSGFAGLYHVGKNLNVLQARD
jgi:hypothetical protein